MIPPQTTLQISPNTGPSLENIIFDPTYYGLTSLIVIVALVAAWFSLRVGRSSEDQNQRIRATATGLAALGFVVVFTAATAFLALLRAGVLGGILYQQAQFSVVYVGSALMLYGVVATMTSAKNSGLQPEHANRETRFRSTVWITYAASVVIVLFYLFSPSTYTITVSGGTQHVAEQGVFWLPVFVTFVVGVGGLPVVALRSKDATVRRHGIWFGFFFVLELIGVLTESRILPSSGDPFVDLLGAFIPFTLGGLCLLASSFSLRSAWLHKNMIEDAMPSYHGPQR